MYAWVYDTDPAGTNVRSGPGTDYSIVTTLPSARAGHDHGVRGGMDAYRVSEA